MMREMRRRPYRSACSGTGVFSFPVSSASRTLSIAHSSIAVWVCSYYIVLAFWNVRVIGVPYGKGERDKPLPSKYPYAALASHSGC